VGEELPTGKLKGILALRAEVREGPGGTRGMSPPDPVGGEIPP
jgi:hypothetical protein